MIGTNRMNFFHRTIPLLFFSISNFLYTCDSLTRDLCHPDQRDTLLEFKNEFEIQYPFGGFDMDVNGVVIWVHDTCYPKTESWGNDSDCCNWDGITCDANSGEAIGLDLSRSCLFGNFKPNSSLLRLKHLRTLNLAYNNFDGSPILTGLNRLTRLERLNLSRSSFSGPIPIEILHLTKLISLDLASDDVVSSSSLFIENSFLRLLSQNLTNLIELDMSYVNIPSKIPQNISNLTSLRSLHLRKCSLFGRLGRNVLLSPTIQSIDLSLNPDLEISLPEFNANNSLVYLDLSQTSLSGNIPDSISNLKHLNVLRFHHCNLTGKIPSSIGSLSHLTSLSLSFCKFSGRIPSFIGNLSHLTFLHLSYNNFSGEIPSTIQNLNRMTNLDVSNNKLSGNFPFGLLNLTKLSYLLLSHNQFTGPLPPNITSLSNLRSFHASGNSFVGNIPPSIFTIPSLTSIYLTDNQLNDPLEFGNITSMSKLRTLDLAQNNFIGPIPRSISKLVNLWELDLSHFNTQGSVDFSIFSPLKSLRYLYLSHLNTTSTIDLNAMLSYFKMLYDLDLSGNHVSATNKRSITDPPTQLRNLNLSGCGIREFPEFIRVQQQAIQLDLSNNKIKDKVPSWLWSLPELKIVDLSNNSFNGFTRDISRTQIYILDLSKNNFSGEILRSICGMSSLEVLDLSNNNLNGSIPQCLNNLIKGSLSVLNLGNNHLSRKLPDIFRNGSNLRSLNVGHNQLVGKLPRSLSGCSSLEVLNVEHNRINDTFPFWLESLQQLQVMVLHSNEFHGSLLYHPRVAAPWFPRLRIIDISHNAYTGTLPTDFFMYWSAMSSKRDGSKLRYIGDDTMYYQDSMVLTNKGVEMKYTRILTLLTAIDFSGNKLRGKIPESIGLLKDLIVLNLSGNGFSGSIPSSLANLTELESLDLSNNELSGQIPPALADLTSLSIIRVSHNKLLGMIPQSTQIQTQNSSGFQDNLGLCGLPLSQKCGDVKSQVPESEVANEEEGVFSWSAAAIGLAPGVILGLTIGFIVVTQKPKWFMKTKPRRRGSR